METETQKVLMNVGAVCHSIIAVSQSTIVNLRPVRGEREITRINKEEFAMTDDVPKIASTLERTKLLMPLCVLLLQGPLMFQRPNTFGVLLFLGCLYTTVNVARILSTHLTAAGISQFTWRGPVQMRWEDVTAVSRRNRSILLSSGERSIIFPTESFYDTRAAVDYLDSHLPQHLRQH